ncbi:conserved exported hypothetical protein [uncultured Paludibacter sp.]|uniref:N-acetylmuramoyl-L-alanine amidase n=1 Tax=uncultured Paludibacter sp. TaxID=497635 RepID=A0A653AHB6_9BACT|nr:conserved exported hypothetical protein [uncultured Paludibacter sp.]
MKKLITLISILAVFSLSAADFTGIKIYINPGHGGYDGANDRNVVTIPYALGDTLGFWESASNLTKGLELRDLLQAQGATVIISRTQNRDEDDRLLSEIAEEANANGVDAFLSIHSNALGTNTGTNYLLQLYHGYDNQPTVEASLPMCKAAWPRLIENKLTVWTNYPTAATPNYRGDFSFYGNTSGLGVLRPLTVPGFLNEGSFHDYSPETHRLLSKDYRKLESYRFLQYFCDYFGKDLPTTGVIGGWVKGIDERVNDSRFAYKTSTDDEWLPLNSANIKLMNAVGDSINNYTVDTLYNGIFTFRNLAPGTYKLRITAKDHTTKDTTIVVSAGTISYMKVMMRNPNLPIYHIIPPDYPNPVQDAGALPMNHYDFQNIKQENPDWVSPTTSIRKVLFKNEKLYILSEDTTTNIPKIDIVNASTFAKIREMDLTGISGGAKILSDINFTADGVLLGCNKDTISLPENKGRYFKMYYWENDSVAPNLLFQTQSQANWANGIVGETFAVTGARFKCSIYTTSVTTGSSKAIRIIGYNYQDSVNLGYRYMLDAANYTEALWGKNVKFNISPNGTDKIVVDGENMLPTEYKFEWEQPDRSPLTLQSVFAEENGYQLQKEASGGTFFRNASHVYMVAPNCDADKSKVGIVLFDVNEGLGNAKKVSEFLPEAGLGTTPAPYMMAAAKVSGYDIDMIGLAEKQGIARFRNIASATANVYASELKMEDIGTAYVLSFTLNDAIASGKVSIFDSTQEVFEVVLGSLEKGVQSVTVQKNDLPEGNYNWSVEVNANNVDRPYKFSDDALAQMQFYYPRGVCVDNTFNSPFFGRVYVAEATGGAASASRTTKDGVYILNSALEDVTNQGANAYAGNITWSTSGSPMRVFVGEDGTVYVNDWSDAHPGIWMMNPASPQNSFAPIFSSALTKAGTGLSSNNGVNVHGSIAHCYVSGLGAERKLFTFDEDYTDAVATSAGNLLQYNIGELATPWDSAPSAIVYNDILNGNLQQNYNSCIVPDGRDGWWISQNRSADAATIPSLIHVKTDGMVDFNSGQTPTLIANSATAGMALNYDGTQIAIGSSNEVKIYSVKYGEDGTPSLSQIYSIKPAVGANTSSISYDRAGNIYVASYNAGGTPSKVGAFALPKITNNFVTPAPVLQLLAGTKTGVQEINSNSDVIIYPNPVSNSATIKSNSELKSISLYDINGRLMMQKALQGLQSDLNISNLSSGIYIVKVQTQNKTFNLRVIKK